MDATTIVDALTAAIADDARILAVTQGGSAVLGAADEYSDLDLVVVCTDAGHLEVLADAHELAERLGPLLVSFTGEHVGEPRLLVPIRPAAPPCRPEVRAPLGPR